MTVTVKSAGVLFLPCSFNSPRLERAHYLTWGWLVCVWSASQTDWLVPFSSARRIQHGPERPGLRGSADERDGDPEEEGRGLQVARHAGHVLRLPTALRRLQSHGDLGFTLILDVVAVSVWVQDNRDRRIPPPSTAGVLDQYRYSNDKVKSLRKHPPHSDTYYSKMSKLCACSSLLSLLKHSQKKKKVVTQKKKIDEGLGDVRDKTHKQLFVKTERKLHWCTPDRETNYARVLETFPEINFIFTMLQSIQSSICCYSLPSRPLQRERERDCSFSLEAGFHGFEVSPMEGSGHRNPTTFVLQMFPCVRLHFSSVTVCLCVNFPNCFHQLSPLFFLDLPSHHWNCTFHIHTGGGGCFFGFDFARNALGEGGRVGPVTTTVGAKYVVNGHLYLKMVKVQHIITKTEIDIQWQARTWKSELFFFHEHRYTSLVCQVTSLTRQQAGERTFRKASKRRTSLAPPSCFRSKKRNTTINLVFCVT